MSITINIAKQTQTKNQTKKTSNNKKTCLQYGLSALVPATVGITHGIYKEISHTEITKFMRTTNSQIKKFSFKPLRNFYYDIGSMAKGAGFAALFGIKTCAIVMLTSSIIKDSRALHKNKVKDL